MLYLESNLHMPQIGARTGRIRHGARWYTMKHSVWDMPAD